VNVVICVLHSMVALCFKIEFQGALGWVVLVTVFPGH